MGKLDILIEYDEAENELEKVNTAISSTPARAKLNKLRSFLTEQQKQINAMQANMESRLENVSRLAKAHEQLQKRYELELSEVEIMNKDEECTSKEIRESRVALEGLLDQINAMRKELTDILSWLDQSSADFKDTWVKAGKAKKEYDSLKLVCETEAGESKHLVDAAKAKVDKIAKNLDNTVLAKYKAVKKNHPDPIARLIGNQCAGCKMSLPMLVVKKVSSGDSIVECENCGRILLP